MSSTESAEPLLSHEDQLPFHHDIRDSRAHFSFYKKWPKHTVVSVATLVFVPLTTVVVLFLLWRAQFRAYIMAGNLSGYLDEIAQTVPVPSRDLKQVLHPEDHVSREASTRSFSWNITKAATAPNGVRKELFLINGMAPDPTRRRLENSYAL